jgi:hypothetical protein
MVVALIALIVATAGTATAARVLITSSKQVKFGSLNGTDIQNRTISGSDIKASTLSSRHIKRGSLTSSLFSADARDALTGGGGARATEVFRKKGPEDQPPGKARVATMSALGPGVYAIFAKATLTSTVGDLGVLTELLKQDKTARGHCALNAAGDQDDAVDSIATPYSASAATMYMQITRSLAAPADIVLECDATTNWRASDSSIIAVRLSDAPRVAVGG